jgi:hypothetical protein
MDAGDMTADLDSFFELLPEPTGSESVPEITPEAIKRRRCACCGLPAKVSFHDLKHHRRTLLCDACRPPAGAAAAPRSK